MDTEKDFEENAPIQCRGCRQAERPTNLEEGEESVGVNGAGLGVGPQKPVDLASNLLESSLVGIAFFQKVAHHRQQRLRTELVSVQILIDLIEAHADPSLKHRLHFHQLHLHQKVTEIQYFHPCKMK